MSTTRLYLSAEMTEPESMQGLGGEVAVFSTRCPQKTTDNEDAAAVISSGDERGVLVVADGMGGGAAGERASKLAVRTIEDRVAKLTTLPLCERRFWMELRKRIVGLSKWGWEPPRQLLRSKFRKVSSGRITWGSAILVMGQRGKLKLATVSHSPVSQAVDLGVIDDAEAMHHEDRHIVSNILGTPEMRIEIGPVIRMSRFDTLFVASDGVFDNLATAEVVDVLRKGPLVEGMSQLVESAHARMETPSDEAPSKPDDLTAIAFRLKSGGKKRG